MPEIAATFFDMDGTLVDTADANFSAYATALSEVGVSIGRTDFDQLAHGRHWTQFLPAILGNRSIDPAFIARRKRLLYPGMMALTRINAHIFALAQAMRATCRIGLVTTASQSSVTAVLDAHYLASFFDVIVTGDDVGQKKPSPEAYLLAAARLDVEPISCLAVEDSDIGVESARRAGMGVLRIETGFHLTC